MTPVCTYANDAAPRFTTRSQIALAACACAGATAFLFAVDPSRHSVYPQCLLYNMTGIYCAGCGATRALYALLHGRFVVALHDNALFVAALPLLLYIVGAYALKAWRANAWPKVPLNIRWLTWQSIAFVMVLIAFMIARNVPGAPFDLLRPL